MIYLADTSVVLSSALNPKRLGPRTARMITDSSETYVSSISIAEIFVKQMLGKIKLNSPISELVKEFHFKALGFDIEMANELATLPVLIGHDPFDRMIVASARAMGATLITSDRQLLGLGFDWIIDSHK
jgi:PIN domain nuclease of toxin-antitoxin system